MVAIADEEAVDEQALVLRGRLLRELRVGADGARTEARDCGDDLEDRARHVQPLGRPVQQRLARVALDSRKGLRGRRGVRHRARVEGGSRGQREDLTRFRVEHDDRA